MKQDNGPEIIWRSLSLRCLQRDEVDKAGGSHGGNIALLSRILSWYIFAKIDWIRS
jgi:hypothetical protein